MADITFEVIESFGEISSKEYDKTNWKTKKKEHIIETKELRKVSWNGGTPKMELRIWKNIDGNEIADKGVTLDEEEMMNLRFLLESLDTTQTEKTDEGVAC